MSNKNNQKLRAGVIGCGMIADAHTCALSKMPEVEIIAVSDIDEKRAENFSKKYGAKSYYRDYNEMLARDDIDFIVNTTANNLHAPLTIAALEAGKHVLVQKPMAMNLQEVDEMISASERTGKKLMVSFFEFFSPPYMHAKEIIEKGLIGDVYYIKGIMGWRSPSIDKWRFDPEISGGGVIMDCQSHHVAFMLWLLNNPKIESVYSEYGALNSKGRVEDTAVTLVRTSAVLGEISGGIRIVEPGFKERIEIFGSKGTIHILATERPSLKVYIEGLEVAPELGGGWMYPKLKPVPYHERGYSLFMNGEDDPWVAEHRHFVNCIRDNVQPVTDGYFGKRVQEVLMAAYESGKDKRAIRFPLPPKFPSGSFKDTKQTEDKLQPA